MILLTLGIIQLDSNRINKSDDKDYFNLKSTKFEEKLEYKKDMQYK